MVDVPVERFEELVADALDEIPDDLWRLVDNVAVVVREGTEGSSLLGLYDGVPLTKRDAGLRRLDGDARPDHASSGCRSWRMCADEAEVVRAGADHGHPRGGPPLRHRRRPAPRARLGVRRYASAVPFSSKLLNEGEDLVLDLHPHWVYFIKSGLLFLAARGVGRRPPRVGRRRPRRSGISSGVLILVALAWIGLDLPRVGHHQLRDHHRPAHLPPRRARRSTASRSRSSA